MAERAARVTFIALLMIFLTVTASLAQGRMGRGPMTPAGTVPGVQNLTQEQTQEISRIRSETQQRVQEIRATPNLTQQQRAQRIQEAQSQGHERVMAVLTPAQRQQFQNWWTNRQRVSRPGGIGAGPMPRGADIGGGVPGVTNLTQEQRQEIAEIRQDIREDVQEVQRNPNLTQQQKAERIARIRNEGHQRVLNVLTPEQRRQFQNWWDTRQRQSMS